MTSVIAILFFHSISWLLQITIECSDIVKRKRNVEYFVMQCSISIGEI